MLNNLNILMLMFYLFLIMENNNINHGRIDLNVNQVIRKIYGLTKYREIIIHCLGFEMIYRNIWRRLILFLSDFICFG